MRRKRAGFSLIELMIVVAIIAILAAIAIPSYQGYMARTQASEALPITSELRTRVIEVHSRLGGNLADISFDELADIDDLTGTYVGDVTIDDSSGLTIQVTFDHGLHANASNPLTITANEDSDGNIIGWNCGGLDSPDDLPHSCQ